MRFLVAALLWLGLCVGAQAQVVFDAISAGAHFTYLGTGTTPITITGGSTDAITVGSGSNRALVAIIVTDGNTIAPTVTSMTWGAQSMTLIGRVVMTTGQELNVELWGLVAPTSGSQTMTVNMSSSYPDFDITAVSFTGVNQTGGVSSFANFNSAQSGTPITTPTVTITSASGDYVVGGLATESIISSFPSGSGTNIFIDNGGTVQSAAGMYTPGASSVAIAGLAASSVYAIAGVDVVAAGGGGGAVTNQTMSLTGVGP
jgi:hypothetical protein